MRPPPAAEWRFPSFLIREFFGRVKVAMVVGSSCVAHLSSASCAKGKSSLGLALRRISFPLPWVAIGWASTGFDEASMRFKQWYDRSEEHTSELPSLMRISYAVFCLKKKKKQ